MTSIYKYSTALWPDTHVILGHRMHPYTVGHALLLERLKSPFVTGDSPPALGDLKLALALCKRPYPVALAIVEQPHRFTLRFTRCPARHFEKAAKQFLAYLAAAFQHPKQWDKEGAPVGTPMLQQ